MKKSKLYSINNMHVIFLFKLAQYFIQTPHLHALYFLALRRCQDLKSLIANPVLNEKDRYSSKSLRTTEFFERRFNLVSD